MSDEQAVAALFTRHDISKRLFDIRLQVDNLFRSSALGSGYRPAVVRLYWIE
jgi:hypothetical protein